VVRLHGQALDGAEPVCSKSNINRANAPRITTMFHWTHTGPNAGLPFCDVTRTEALERGEGMQHPAYNREGYELQRNTVCRDCLKEWDYAVCDD